MQLAPRKYNFALRLSILTFASSLYCACTKSDAPATTSAQSTPSASSSTSTTGEEVTANPSSSVDALATPSTTASPSVQGSLPPGTLQLITDMTSELKTGLVASGLSASQAAFVAEAANAHAQVQYGAIAISTNLTAASKPISIIAPAFIEGAMEALSNTETNLPAVDDRVRYSGAIVGQTFISLSGRTSELTASESLELHGNLGAAGISSLTKAGITEESRIHGAEAITEGAIGSLAAAGVSATDTNMVAGAIVKAEVKSYTALTETGANKLSKSVLGAEAIANEAVYNLVDADATSTTKAGESAGAISGKALAGLSGGGLSASELLTTNAVANVVQASLTALSTTGFTDTKVAAAMASAAHKSVTNLGESGFSSAAQISQAVGQLTNGTLSVLGNISLTDSTEISSTLKDLAESTVTALPNTGISTSVDIGATAALIVHQTVSEIGNLGLIGSFDIVNSISAVARGASQGFGSVSQSGSYTGSQIATAASKIAAGATDDLAGLAQKGLLSSSFSATLAGNVMKDTLIGLSVGGVTIETQMSNAVTTQILATVSDSGLGINATSLEAELNDAADSAASFADQSTDPTKINFPCESHFGDDLDEPNFRARFSNSLTKNYSAKFGFVLCKSSQEGICPRKRSEPTYIVKWRVISKPGVTICESIFRESKPTTPAQFTVTEDFGSLNLSWTPMTTPLSLLKFSIKEAEGSSDAHHLTNVAGTSHNFNHTSLNPCSIHSYSMTASNFADESAPTQTISRRVLPYIDITATASVGKITLTKSLTNTCVTSANLYYATAPFASGATLTSIQNAPQLVAKISNVTFPYEHTSGLSDGQIYYYVVTGLIDGVESPNLTWNNYTSATFNAAPIPVPANSKLSITAPFFAMTSGERAYIPQDNGCINFSADAMKPDVNNVGQFVTAIFNSNHDVDLATNGHGHFYASINCSGAPVTRVTMDNTDHNRANFSYRTSTSEQETFTFTSNGFTNATWTLTPATDVSAGREHACAILSDQQIVCWGFNGAGQLGIGSTQSQQPRRQPVYVIDASNSSRVIGATFMRTLNHSNCAIVSGRVKCWGGSFPNSATEIAAFGSDNTLVTFNATHMCTLKTDTTVQCRGTNGYGELGDGTTTNSTTTPVTVRVADISSGNPSYDAGHSTFLTTGNLTDVVDVYVGPNNACALQSVAAGGKIYCWGVGPGNMGLAPGSVFVTNYDHYINGGGTYYPYQDFIQAGIPVRSEAGGNPILTGMKGLSSQTDYYGCGITGANAGVCWGPIPPSGSRGSSYADAVTFPDTTALTGATSVSTGNLQTCFVVDGVATVDTVAKNGAVTCFGMDNHGQTGRGSYVASSLPTLAWVRFSYAQVDETRLGGYQPINDPTLLRVYGVEKLSAGYDQTCAIIRGGVFCWGRRSGGGVEGSGFGIDHAYAVWVGSSGYYPYFTPGD